MHQVRTFIWVFVFIAMTCISHAQEFPIAAGKNGTFLSGGAFDGTNCLLGILGDALNPGSITAQLVSGSGGLVGSRISLGVTGGWPLVAFDGSNYLMVWSSNANTVEGQFINTSGTLVRTNFVIANNAAISGPKGGSIAFGDTTYMVVYKNNDMMFGQRVSKSGALISTPTQISSNSANDDEIAFDGTNYLVAWCDGVNDKEIYGQFVSMSGALVGTNFLIDGGQGASDNPVVIAFDGSRYLVCFHDQSGVNSGRWNLFARFVTPSGTVSDKITIRDYTYDPIFPMIAFDGTDYLVAWTEGFTSSGAHSKGRFFNTSGIPLGDAFTLFDTLGGKSPSVAGLLYGNNNFFVGTTRVVVSISPGGQFGFADGEVYGKIIQARTTDVNAGQANQTPREFSLFQNYPNPFNPTTTISFALPNRSHVALGIYNILGLKVAELVNGDFEAGYHEVKYEASNVASGVYFYRLKAGTFLETKRLVVLH